MITCEELIVALRGLGIRHDTPILGHASLSAFGDMQGGAEAFLKAMLAVFDTLIMPSFTFKTILLPGEGPANNGITYGSETDHNRMAEFFRPEMEADRLMGVLAEFLRRHPGARRSQHPILSFSGINAGSILDSQTIEAPLAPIGAILAMGGWVLLLGVDHTVNTSIHYAEKLAGRKQFIRWALTPQGVVECPGFPGCSDGFNAIAPFLDHTSRSAVAGLGRIQALPLVEIITIAREWIERDALALLCDRSSCERCQAVRQEVRQ